MFIFLNVADRILGKICSKAYVAELNFAVIPLILDKSSFYFHLYP